MLGPTYVHDIHKLCYLWRRIRRLRLKGEVVRATDAILFSDILSSLLGKKARTW